MPWRGRGSPEAAGTGGGRGAEERGGEVPAGKGGPHRGADPGGVRGRQHDDRAAEAATIIRAPSAPAAVAPSSRRNHARFGPGNLEVVTQRRMPTRSAASHLRHVAGPQHGRNGQHPLILGDRVPQGPAVQHRIGRPRPARPRPGCRAATRRPAPVRPPTTFQVPGRVPAVGRLVAPRVSMSSRTRPRRPGRAAPRRSPAAAVQQQGVVGLAERGRRLP